MSRIANNPINIPTGVGVNIVGNLLGYLLFST